jgi:hypothetical protein
MKNTIKRDANGAVIAPTCKEENIFWVNRGEIVAKADREGRDLDMTAAQWAHEHGIEPGTAAYRLHMDHLMLLMNRNKGLGMDDWK